MNKKGFTLVEMLTVLVIITIISLIAVSTISAIQKRNEEELYHSYEKMMVEYAEVSIYKNNEIISLNELEELQDVKDKCNGYVKKENGKFKAYISCGKYETTGYNSSNLN